jgi:hypothetical protein
MKIFFKIVCILSISTFYCYGQDKKCSDFKTGKFVYTKPEYKRYKMIRTETTQIETDSITGLVLEGAINWKSECVYELTYTKISDKKYSNLIGQKINAEIIKILGNNLICKSEGAGTKLELEMTKID